MTTWSLRRAGLAPLTLSWVTDLEAAAVAQVPQVELFRPVVEIGDDQYRFQGDRGIGAVKTNRWGLPTSSSSPVVVIGQGRY